MMKYALGFFLTIFICSEVISQIIENDNHLTDEKIINTREKVIIDYKNYLNASKATGTRGEMPLILPIRGQNIKFKSRQNHVMDDETRRLFPDIVTLDIWNEDGSSLSGAITLSSFGLFATIFEQGRLVSIYPENMFNPDVHIIEYGIQPDMPRLKNFCGVDHTFLGFAKQHQHLDLLSSRAGITVGSRRYNYRVAIVTTGEFYKNNGNNDNMVRTVVINTVNAISAIFSREMSFKLSVDNRIFLYRDPVTDPFIPDEAGGPDRPTQAGTVVSMNFSSASYDIGHVFHQHEDGDGWGNGGIAQLNSVCNNFGNSKARGWSGGYTNTGNSWINLATHEFGHQFGANHTFNGIGESCTDAIALDNAYEIGSGTTIMSYNGICDPSQNIPSSDEADNYFHIKSIEEMYRFVYTGVGGTCGNPVNSPNMLPSVNANPCNAVYNIPKNTPFYLKAEGNWTDNDNHDYTWEQIDEDGPSKPTQGSIGSAAANSTLAPLFRSYPPVKSPERYFPALNTLRAGTIDPFDALPNVARQLNFNVAMRDNNVDGGAVANDNIKINVLNSGPFVITRPNGGEVLQAGQTENITWNTNGSNALCSKVRIRLSVDGGFNFGIILAENINYSSGTFSFIIPNNISNTTQARIMVECMDYDCFRIFNISRNNFRINSSCRTEPSFLCPQSLVSLDEGDPGLNLNMPKIKGQIITNYSKAITSASPVMPIVVKGVNGVGCKTLINLQHERIRIIPEQTGVYNFNIDREFGDGFGFISVFRASNFSASNPCPSFVSSSGTWTGTTNIVSASNQLSIQLSECTEYVIVFYNYASLPITNRIVNIQGPGDIIEINTVNDPLYNQAFIAVDKNTGLIAYVNAVSDFTSIASGNYNVYLISYTNSENISNFIGKSISNLSLEHCAQVSGKFRPLEVKSTCKINDIVAGTQGPCTAATNAFAQDVIITYTRPPSTGQLSVNGQLFNITSSPQTVTLTGLDSDGTLQDVTAFFTEFPACTLKKTALFRAPVNCCPLNFDLGPDLNKCVGESVMLVGGDNGILYVWKKDGVVISSANSKTIPVFTSGFYEVEVTHSTGCKKSDGVNITFNPLPDIVLTNNITICEGDTYTLNPVITNGALFQWFRNDILIPGEDQSTIQISENGSYKVAVTSNFGCKNTGSIIVNTTKAPVVNLGIDQQKCEGETALLNAGFDGDTYAWYKDNVLISGAINNTYSAVQSGIYRVVVTNSALCVSEDQVKIDFFASPEILGLEPVVNICQGTSTTLTAKVPDFKSLQWYYENNPVSGANGLTIVASNSGNYTLEAVNLAGCKTRRGTMVEVRSLPVVDLGPNEIVSCIGNPVTLFAGSDGSTYSWSQDGNILSEKSNQLAVNLSGMYKVSVTNTFNCTSTDEILISFIAGPNVMLNGDATICEGTNHTIMVTTNAVNPEIRWFYNSNQISGANELSLSVQQAGLYEVIIKGGTPACEVRKSVTVTVNPKPAFNLGNDRAICEGETFPVLNGGAGNTNFNWTWNGMPLSSTQTVTADKTGIYSVTVTNSFNCIRSEQVKIEIHPLPTLVMEDAFNLCENKTITINPETNGSVFEWKRNNITINNQTGKTLTVNQAGTFHLIVSNSFNCRREKTFTVTTRPNPDTELGANISLCPDDMVILDAGLHQQYQWSDNSSSKVLLISAGKPTVSQTKLYSVTVTNEYGCKDADSITITLYPVVTATITSDKPGVCNGEPVTLTAKGGTVFLWSDPGGGTLSSLNTAATQAFPKETTTYSVRVSDGICPENTDTKNIEIKVFEPKNISAGKDTCVVEGRTIKLNASGGVKYDWNNKDLIIGPSNIANPVVKPTTETIFTVTVTDINGCIFTDEVTICIKAESFKPVSIITPNNDGKNDELYFGDLNDYPDNQLKIFNRWGNLIFEAKGYQLRGALFNGYRNGERLPADTYYYILTFGDQVVKSSLTILWD